MRKIKISVAAICIACGSMLFSNCIGSFSLTNSVLSWNKGVGSKFVNELVFFAFWILPVYEVTALADMLVLNSIEFWGGKNPVEASVKTVETPHGNFMIASDAEGYTIKDLSTGLETRLKYDNTTMTWAVEKDGVNYPFMTFVDDAHLKMITPEGDFRLVELSESGLAEYAGIATDASKGDLAMQ